MAPRRGRGRARSRGRSFKTRPGSGARSPARRPGLGGAGAAGRDARRGRGLRRPPARRHAGEEPVQPGGRWLRLPRPAAQRGGLPARHPLPGQGEPRARSPPRRLGRGAQRVPPACHSPAAPAIGRPWQRTPGRVPLLWVCREGAGGLCGLGVPAGWAPVLSSSRWRGTRWPRGSRPGSPWPPSPAAVILQLWKCPWATLRESKESSNQL